MHHACTKGLKGRDFKPVIKWLIIVSKHFQQLMSLVNSEEESFDNVLSVVMCGLPSINERVAEKSLDLTG